MGLMIISSIRDFAENDTKILTGGFGLFATDNRYKWDGKPATQIDCSEFINIFVMFMKMR